MSDLRELYQEVILDHNRNPKNHHDMQDATGQAVGYNPLCGDKLTVYVKVNGDKLEKVSFVGCGCAISQASASIMTEIVMHKMLTQVHTLFHHVQHIIMGTEEATAQDNERLMVLAGVREFPARVKCATLAWHTLEAALKNTVMVSTE